MSFLHALQAGVAAFRQHLPRASAGATFFPAQTSPFDASNSSVNRTNVQGFPMDSMLEITPLRRREIVRKSRSLRNNFPFLRALVNTTTNLAIGTGLVPMPASGNKDYDRRALAYWKRWSASKALDVTGKHKYIGLQRLTCNELQVDGELFQLKVANAFGQRQRQLFKTECVGYGYGSYDPLQPVAPEPGANWVDGIQCDELNKPVSYRFLQRQFPGTSLATYLVPKFTERPARMVNHVYEKERATQNRGLPWAYCGLNSFMDVLDINMLEMVGHKLNAAIVGSITTKDGSPTKAMQNVMSAAQLAAGQPVSATVPDDGTRFLNLNGTQIPIFQAGENMTFNDKGRSMSPMEFGIMLLRATAAGYGIPFDVAYDWSGLGGATVRAACEMTGRFLDRVQMLMVDDMCQPDWQDVVGAGILAYLYPKDYPLVEPLAPPPGFTGWDTVTWRGPKDITVDRGKDGRLYLDLVTRGLMSRQEWHCMNAEDPQGNEDLILDEISDRLAAWLAKGLSEEMFWRREFSQLPAFKGEPDPALADDGKKPPPPKAN